MDNNFNIEAIDSRIKEFLLNPARKVQHNPIKLLKSDKRCKLDEKISIARCIPYENYLKQKHNQLLKLQTTYERTINYFKKASEKCNHVLEIQNCYKIMVKSTTTKLNLVSINKLKIQFFGILWLVWSRFLINK